MTLFGLLDAVSWSPGAYRLKMLPACAASRVVFSALSPLAVRLLLKPRVMQQGRAQGPVVGNGGDFVSFAGKYVEPAGPGSHIRLEELVQRDGTVYQVRRPGRHKPAGPG
jgi:hypothetical protein